MPTIALIGAELFPVPVQPIRGGAAKLFIEQVASRLRDWRPVVISRADPELPDWEQIGGVEYVRLLAGWRFRLYKRYPQLFPIDDRQVLKIVQAVKPDLLHVHNRPLLALYLQKQLGARTSIILHPHNLYTPIPLPLVMDLRDKKNHN